MTTHRLSFIGVTINVCKKTGIEMTNTDSKFLTFIQFNLDVKFEDKEEILSNSTKQFLKPI